ncbi:MAG: filamentous hemagglutinin N-terminal domain-containing protein [Cyanobacteria bacterium P01_A01_bin.123]
MALIAGLRAGLVLLLSTGPALLTLPALANPSVTAAPDGTGTAVTFDAASQTYTINGGTQVDANLFHSFQQFGLSTNEIANFLANPDVSNILARVSGGQTSVINGLLQVSGGNNANLFILNPAGVLLGRNAHLNLAGSFSISTASGLAFSDSVFNATGSNDYSALTGNPTGYVFLGNEGVLLNEADLAVNPGESLTLAGSTVINTGSLEASGGSVSIVAVPEEGILSISQDGLVMSLAVPSNQLQDLVDSGITPLDLPSLLAGEWGGNATTVSTLDDGTVVLSSGDAVNTTPRAVTGTGTVDVSGNQGGQVQVLGETIALNGATINASGTEGGGNVGIGGDYLGQGDLPTAQFTQVDAATTISADAIQTGDGGQVIVWADQDTLFAGQISAQGGAVAGDGGFVETSGAQRLTVANTAEVATRAMNGVWGTWLLDPADLTVGATGTASAATGTNLPAGDSTIAASNVVTSLDGTNVTLQATNSITVDAAIDASGNANAGNLTLQAPTANLNQRITLRAGSTLAGTGVNTVNVGGSGSVQNGVDVAAASGTVNVAPGTFTEGQTIAISRAVTISGAGETSTVLDGSGTHQVLNNSSTDALTLENLTVQNGSTTGNGGGFSSNGAVTLSNSTVSGNSAGDRGGGIYTRDAVTLSNSTVSGNSATDNGGGIYGRNGLITMTNSTVSGNSSNRYGGGIYTRSVITVTNSTVSGNSSRRNGGGLYSRSGAITVTNSTVSGNSSNRHTGGIWSRNRSITLTDSTVSGNSARLSAAGVYSRDVTVTNSTVSGNSAGDLGGGLYATGSLTITNSTISGNSAANKGGGSYHRNHATITNSTISGNSSNRGGGMYARGGGDVTVINSTVSGNSTSNRGGGIFTRNNGGGNLILNNATIAFNTSNSLGGGIFVNTTRNNTISNSIIANNVDVSGSAPDISANLSSSTITNSLIQDTTGITAGAPIDRVDGNIVGQDPLLAPLADNNGPTQTHGLLIGSPAINASGTGATAADQRGVAAIGIRDIGAFEGIVDVNILDPDILFNRPDALRIAEGPNDPVLTIDQAFAEDLGILERLNDDGTLRSTGTDGDIHDATPPPATQDQANDSDGSDDALCATGSDAEGEPNNEGSCPTVIP